ncbi:MAG: YXWGXW repeat-containing protein [Parafilimonas sp.]
MKKHLLKYLLAMFILTGVCSTTYAQTRIYVKVRPTEVITTQTVAPHSNYVWIGDEWKMRNGGYVHVAGHWMAPRKGYVWIPGHWATEARGDYWVRGHWRKV